MIAVVKQVKADEVAELVADLCRQANYTARPDVRELTEAALNRDNSPPARQALEQLVANMDVAAGGALPLCQDCGYVTVFASVGREIHFESDFAAAVQAGVVKGYEEGYLRRSVVRDALFERGVPETDRPANIYIDLVEGDGLSFTVMPKGGGSDNAGRMVMFRPTAAVDEIVEFVVDTVAASGASACPPLFVGVGIGGSFDSVGLLAKKALLRDFRVPAPTSSAADLEARLLSEINQLGIGPAGLGGQSTALGVAVATDKTHIACLPVVVNLSCNQLRFATGAI